MFSTYVFQTRRDTLAKFSAKFCGIFAFPSESGGGVGGGVKISTRLGWSDDKGSRKIVPNVPSLASVNISLNRIGFMLSFLFFDTNKQT